MGPFTWTKSFSVVAMVAGLTACAGSGDNRALNNKPTFVTGTVQRVAYDGTADDLLTAGLGKAGLQSATAPTVADAANPTVTELRRLAIYNNYRALVDTTANGGFGLLYGPNVDAAGAAGTGDGKIAGEEFIAYADDGTGKQNVTLLVQVPRTLSATAPCIVSAASSGSRGVYGAIATAGEWGLKHGCAVAYTDKGTGNGAHDLASNTVFDINGKANTAVAGAQFVATLPSGTAANNRVAFKHAHSMQNPEKDWGTFTLQAIEFALWAINESIGENRDGARLETFNAANTLVIASSVSNGAGAALMAAELDSKGLIDGVAVAEPQIQPDVRGANFVRVGGVDVANLGKGLLDYTTQAMLLQPCAALADSVKGAPAVAFINAAAGGKRCASLAAAGLVAGADLAAQSSDALAKLRAYGWPAEADVLHAAHFAFAVPAISVTYANTYAKASVADNLCGYGFAATGADFKPTAVNATAFARLFATGNGIPPTGGVNIVNFNAPSGPIIEGAGSPSANGTLDYNFDGARCLASKVADATVVASVAAVKRSGNLQGKPAIIVHGRSDALVPVNHSSRPYVALNKAVEGGASKLSYIEVTNAQHFDAFIGNAALAGFDTRFIPLHVYFNRAMDAMYAHLKEGKALPPSQVVRTTPRGGTPGAAPAITAANVPTISNAPAAGDAITFLPIQCITTPCIGGTLDIPN
jgi:hydroxybutyrate-dimer hydrolase